MVLFLLTEVVKNTFEVGIEFNEEYKAEYENLENPTTQLFVNKIKDAVSAIFWLGLNILYLWFVTYIRMVFGNFPKTAPQSAEWSWINSEYLWKKQRKKCNVVSLKEAGWLSGQRVKLKIQRSRSGHYLELFLGSPEFKCSASLVNSQLVCLLPDGIHNNGMFNLNYLFQLFAWSH